MENPHKKKNWNEKYLSSMKYTSFERRNYYISTLDGAETYIIGYNLDKKEGFIPNTNEIVKRSIIKNETSTQPSPSLALSEHNSIQRKH